MRAAQATFAKEHYANGAEGNYRYIYPAAGSPRGDGPDFWVSTSSPTMASWGESIDIFWEKSYGSEAERERWNHMTCDANSTWFGWRVHNLSFFLKAPSNIRRSFYLRYKYGSKSLFSNNFFM